MLSFNSWDEKQKWFDCNPISKDKLSVEGTRIKRQIVTKGEEISNSHIWERREISFSNISVKTLAVNLFVWWMCYRVRVKYYEEMGKGEFLVTV